MKLPILPFLMLPFSGAGCVTEAAHVRYEHPVLVEEAPATRTRPPSASLVPFWDDALPPDDPESRAARQRIAASATRAVGRRQMVVAGRKYRMDCSGVARAIYADAGIRLGTVPMPTIVNDTRMLFELVKRSGSLRRTHPLPGDLVFFDDTYDADGDGRRNDSLSHVGVVEKVDDDGTVSYVNRVGSTVLRFSMNLTRPHDRIDEATGKVLNHFLRKAEGGEQAKTSAELFVAYGTMVVPPAENRPVAMLWPHDET